MSLDAEEANTFAEMTRDADAINAECRKLEEMQDGIYWGGPASLVKTLLGKIQEWITKALDFVRRVTAASVSGF